MAGRQGFFISFEGIDGAGKSTQVASLAASLHARRYDVVSVRPTSTALGDALHTFLLHPGHVQLEPWTEVLLFNAERVQLLHEIILPALQRGSVVIADRFVDSTLAYQGGGRGVPRDDILELHRRACGDIWPDLTLYLDISPQAAAQRQRVQQLPLDRIEGSPQRFHNSVRAAFDDIARANPDRVVRIDATRAALDVARDVEAAVRARVPDDSAIPAAHAAVPS